MDIHGALLAFVRWKSGDGTASLAGLTALPDELRSLAVQLHGYTWASVSRKDGATHVVGACNLGSPWRYGLAQIESAVLDPIGELNRLRGIERDHIGHYLMVEVVDACSVRATLAVHFGPGEWRILDEHVVNAIPVTLDDAAARLAGTRGTTVDAPARNQAPRTRPLPAQRCTAQA
ncbi:MAG: hypothetical protein JSR67_14820 [Proteobacteria bacterium]|nr:hypothetical protein [Pseudomonadota bacterium]